jgi:hypothetical protein
MEVNQNTPIDGEILPPWGKLAAIENVLKNGDIDKSIPIIQLSVRGSYSGWALGALAPKLGYQIQIAYPNAKNFPEQMIEKFKQYPVELVPMRPNMMSVVLGQTKKYARENNLQMIPYGFEHPLYLEWFENKIKEYDFDTLVVCAGTPVTSLGMIRGFTGKEIHCIATCKERTVLKQFEKYKINPEDVNIHVSPYDFYDEMEDFTAPFACNRNWDLKVWKWITENANHLNGNVLFWNLGA